ncbi:MAG: hypothetical protein DHS20C12_00870 [Pseudohongiella sp.]|nr:MAG: hypothetical protein DHS20C12_00870 [Pseudohongiella sp.]
MKLLNLRKFKKIVSTITIASVLAMGLQSATFADVVTTEQLVESSSLESKRNQVNAFMARGDVKQQLQKLGVSEQTIDQRLNSLTDSEILEMHNQIEDLPAGEGFFGGVIAILVILMLLDMAGVTDIFPRI